MISKSDCIFMLINYMTTYIESVKLSRDFVILFVQPVQ